MRSYYAHLGTLIPPTTEAIAPRPTLRSSAIFPVMQRMGISSRILFMGYWILKRHIKEIAAVITLRELSGKVLCRQDFLIQEAKTFRIELQDLLNTCQYDSQEFTGSLEIEFFSTHNLFFPFPAVVINYYGPGFSSVVHTAQRVYNDWDDMHKNSQTSVPESGFNIYASKQQEPFIGIINGSVRTEKSRLTMRIINHAQKVLDCDLELEELAPYETKVIFPAKVCDLISFLEGKPGAGKINFHVNWIFPRLLVGNLPHDIPALTITHTYYDCSQACSESDYWHPIEPGWYAAALMVPCIVSKEHFTTIYFYPIYSPSQFVIHIEIYDKDGLLLGTKLQAATIHAPEPKVHCIALKEVCQELGLDDAQDYSARLIAVPAEGERIPARIKIGLDVGISGKTTPCNICTNLQPFNPSLENKPTSFRWAPVLADQPQASVWIMNSSPAILYARPAELKLTFFHESDDQTVTREVTIVPNGFYLINPQADAELKAFFNNTVGWVTIVTSNPYTTSYYFAETPQGVVGGDHGF